MDVDGLVRLKLAGEREDVGDIATLSDGDAGSRHGGGAGGATVATLRVAGAEMDDGKGRHDRRSTRWKEAACGSCVIRMHWEDYS
jgi:hypothetical protein